MQPEIVSGSAEATLSDRRAWLAAGLMAVRVDMAYCLRGDVLRVYAGLATRKIQGRPIRKTPKAA
jgi:hypothetical protein